MGKKTIAKFALTLAGILLVMTACRGNSPANDPARDLKPTPTLVAVGSTMEKPVPYGYDIILQDIVITLNGLERPANEIVAEKSAVTPTPENGQEYFLIKINNQCVKPGQVKCFVGFSDYQLMDSMGNFVNPEDSVSGMDGFFTFEEFSSGTSNKGYLAFLVNQDVEYPLLTYKTFLGTSVYLSLVY